MKPARANLTASTASTPQEGSRSSSVARNTAPTHENGRVVGGSSGKVDDTATSSLPFAVSPASADASLSPPPADLRRGGASARAVMARVFCWAQQQNCVSRRLEKRGGRTDAPRAAPRRRERAARTGARRGA